MTPEKVWETSHFIISPFSESSYFPRLLTGSHPFMELQCSKLIHSARSPRLQFLLQKFTESHSKPSQHDNNNLRSLKRKLFGCCIKRLNVRAATGTLKKRRTFSSRHPFAFVGNFFLRDFKYITLAIYCCPRLLFALRCFSYSYRPVSSLRLQ